MTRTLFIAFWSPQANEMLIEVSQNTLKELRFAEKMKKKYNSHPRKNFFIHPNRTGKDSQWYESCQEAVEEFRDLTLGEKSLMTGSLAYFLFIIDRESLPYLLLALSDEEFYQLAKPRIVRRFSTKVYLDSSMHGNEMLLSLPLCYDKNGHYYLDLEKTIGVFSLS